MRYAKAIAAVIGGLTPAAVVGILAAFHVNINAALIAQLYAVAGPVLAGVFTARGPANKAAAAVQADEKPAPVAAAPVVEPAAPVEVTGV